MEVRQVNTAEYLSEIIEILRQGREVSIPVKGNSMAPFLREGRDAVLLGLFPESQIREMWCCIAGAMGNMYSTEFSAEIRISSITWRATLRTGWKVP